MDSKISSHHAEGERMRELMKAFEIQKKGFTTNSRDIRIDLPEPFENLTMEGVAEGEITIPLSVNTLSALELYTDILIAR